MAAASSAEDDAEHAGVAVGGPAMRFRQGKALQVVAEVQRALQACLQILRHALAGQCRHVRAELAAAAVVAHAGQGDADGGITAAQRRIGLGHQRHHRLQEAVVVTLWGGHAAAPGDLHRRIARHQLDLGAADVDAVAGVGDQLSHGGW